MWFRPFPTGFHYSGYAHEGAFWLTVALAMATITLSLSGRPEASVQIIMHPMHADGMLPLLSLIDCEDVIIRDGVRALAGKWWLQLNEKEMERQDATLLHFREYAYQWY